VKVELTFVSIVALLISLSHHQRLEASGHEELAQKFIQEAVAETLFDEQGKFLGANLNRQGGNTAEVQFLAKVKEASDKVYKQLVVGGISPEKAAEYATEKLANFGPVRNPCNEAYTRQNVRDNNFPEIGGQKSETEAAIVARIQKKIDKGETVSESLKQKVIDASSKETQLDSSGNACEIGNVLLEKLKTENTAKEVTDRNRDALATNSTPEKPETKVDPLAAPKDAGTNPAPNTSELPKTATTVATSGNTSSDNPPVKSSNIVPPVKGPTEPPEIGLPSPTPTRDTDSPRFTGNDPHSGDQSLPSFSEEPVTAFGPGSQKISFRPSTTGFNKPSAPISESAPPVEHSFQMAKEAMTEKVDQGLISPAVAEAVLSKLKPTLEKEPDVIRALAKVHEEMQTSPLSPKASEIATSPQSFREGASATNNVPSGTPASGISKAVSPAAAPADATNDKNAKITVFVPGAGGAAVNNPSEAPGPTLQQNLASGLASKNAVVSPSEKAKDSKESASAKTAVQSATALLGTTAESLAIPGVPSKFGAAKQAADLNQKKATDPTKKERVGIFLQAIANLVRMPMHSGEKARAISSLKGTSESLGASTESEAAIALASLSDSEWEESTEEFFLHWGASAFAMAFAGSLVGASFWKRSRVRSKRRS
jgi:hypothetical protein